MAMNFIVVQQWLGFLFYLHFSMVNFYFLLGVRAPFLFFLSCCVTGIQYSRSALQCSCVTQEWKGMYGEEPKIAAGPQKPKLWQRLGHVCSLTWITKRAQSGRPGRCRKISWFLCIHLCATTELCTGDLIRAQFVVIMSVCVRACLTAVLIKCLLNH